MDELDQKNEIKELIKQENDPEKRAMLLILDSINENLVENTRYTRNVADQLAAHMQDFGAHRKEFFDHLRADEATKNQLKGGGKVAKILVNVIRVITLTACTLIYNDLRSIHAELKSDQIEHQIFKDKLQFLEKKGNK